MLEGLSERLTSGGLPVLHLHYSADPSKRPGTEEGDKWLAEASSGYPGGTNSPRWRKEMEIDWGALSGTRLFPQWEQWSQNQRIVIPPFIPHGYRLYGSYDHGWRHPACYLVHGINPEGQIVTLWEFHASQVPVSQIARIIKGESVTVADGRRFPGNPYAGQEIYKVADCAIFAEDQAMSDNTMKSIATLFRMDGIVFIPAQQGGDTMVAEWLHGYWWQHPMEPLYRITTACQKLIWEIGQQRHKDISAQVALNKAQPEQLVDKNNDAWDAMKYFLQRFPPKPMQERAEKKAGSFMWWRKLNKLEKQGEAMPTYKREMVG